MTAHGFCRKLAPIHLLGAKKMKPTRSLFHALLAAALLLSPLVCQAHGFSGEDPSNGVSLNNEAVVSSRAAAPGGHGFSGIGLGVGISPLGIGVQAATPLAGHINLRAGANFFSYSRSFTSDGINYDGSLSLRSFDALLDLFPFHGGLH